MAENENQTECGCLLCQMNLMLLEAAEQENTPDLNAWADDLTEAEQLDMALANIAALMNGQTEIVSSDDLGAILRAHGYEETVVDEDDEDNEEADFEDLTFSQALDALKEGFFISRAGWNGKGMFLALVDPDGQGTIQIEGDEYELLSWIGMKTTGGQFVPWLASQTDLLAEDWVVLV